jgi:hypothetical protein
MQLETKLIDSIIDTHSCFQGFNLPFWIPNRDVPQIFIPGVYIPEKAAYWLIKNTSLKS